MGLYVKSFSCCLLIAVFFFAACKPKAKLVPTEKFEFNSFVDCNMATVWVGDTFRIFPGKYGEDPLWGDAHELKYASGNTVDEAFSRRSNEFTEPVMPMNAAVGKEGLHGAVWFETLFQDKNDTSGKTIYALYHNENYPSTLPYDSISGVGYRDIDWPQGLKGPETKTAVCRIGIMKSTDGGRSWSNRGIVLEDYQPRLILRPNNTGINFAGGVGDPSAVANGGYLYIFYGEYGYPGEYNPATYDPSFEWKGQCISMARIALADLDNPVGKARRWDGKGFNAAATGIGVPVSAIRIPRENGGGPASSPVAKYYWGPSVSWNNHLKCWVMLMAKAEGPSWKGSSIYISFNPNADLGQGDNSQQWSRPELLLDKPGHILWYPSLQPVNSAVDKAKKYTSLNLGKTARLFFKDQFGGQSPYVSEYLVEFK
ncbi:DUF4185 domain-containing protein [Flavihumibacter profundi]|jgi:hypothetical protein|uniref:DUF4185 domain-containing protein n=1 Tax=Flavihumibacter profundi TaxID=2716883 RepID=UPI001CC5F2A7|nr:DUF4185 domain-containing protein [Flavihumibacter profundi]MBZ5856003.1 DUF4185 domain-containing protein [Flavihumibacter profundi]